MIGPVNIFLCYHPDEGVVKKIQTLRVNVDDFTTIKLLATGAVGKVFLVKSKFDGKFYAMKKLKKVDLLSQREAAFFMEEKNAMALSRSSTWITSLYAAFQDKEHLYLLMEFAPGGTLDKLMERQDVIKEDDAKFYVAEVILAIEELHKQQYIHRDIKPANILLDVKGHVRLADFGSCIKTDDSKIVKSSSPLATKNSRNLVSLDYIAPEVLRATETGGGYGAECDWWSLGVTVFEMLVGATPFDGDSLMQVYGEIMNHQKTFAFPPDAEISEEARTFISGLITKREARLGANGAQELKEHPWFRGIDWQSIRAQQAPWIPDVKGPDDTTYCHVANEEFNPIKPAGRLKPNADPFPGNSLPFIGYNYLK
ncbi:kinase-like protein, partial [Gonapodya prolifera JEL478]